MFVVSSSHKQLELAQRNGVLQSRWFRVGVLLPVANPVGRFRIHNLIDFLYGSPHSTGQRDGVLRRFHRAELGRSQQLENQVITVRKPSMDQTFLSQIDERSSLANWSEQSPVLHCPSCTKTYPNETNEKTTLIYYT